MSAEKTPVVPSTWSLNSSLAAPPAHPPLALDGVGRLGDLVSLTCEHWPLWQAADLATALTAGTHPWLGVCPVRIAGRVLLVASTDDTPTLVDQFKTIRAARQVGGTIGNDVRVLPLRDTDLDEAAALDAIETQAVGHHVIIDDLGRIAHRDSPATWRRLQRIARRSDRLVFVFGGDPHLASTYSDAITSIVGTGKGELFCKSRALGSLRRPLGLLAAGGNRLWTPASA